MREVTVRSELVDRLEDLLLVLQKWKTHFGTAFGETWNGAQHADQGKMKTIRDLVETAQSCLNSRDDQGRLGEASLLLRDAREDRLLLRYSTSRNLLKGQANENQVKDPKSYFDDVLNCYCYPLYDRLVETRERSSEKARESRGLTGWVALTGHYLVVNGEYGKQGLLTLDEDRPETKGACQTYGCPIWGHHVSEAPSDPARPKRYIAVPVKSTADPNRTIGVLRYACSGRGRELSDADLLLLKEIADLVSAGLGLDATVTRALRWSRIGEQTERLRSSYDFGEFLEFLAKSLGSSIASVYLDIRGVVGSESRLRLLDAFGISAPVADLRDGIQDYQTGDGGFTRWLFDHVARDITVVPSVHAHRSWKGKNTVAFYGEQFKALMDGTGAARGQPTEIAKRYEIKIIGVPLFSYQDKVGVLKVELPTSFDDSRHYDKDDQEFFAKCAVAFGEVLGDFRSFLKCEWFVKPPLVTEFVNITRMATAALRTRFVSPAEAKEFWGQLDAFVESNAVQVADEMSEFLARLPENQREVVQKSESWLTKFAKDVLTDGIAKVLVEAMRKG
jgi:hypothetical protein